MTVVVSIASAITIILGAYTLLKDFIWGKPQLLNVENCFVSIPDAGEGKEIHFELLVNNAGSKDCSVISVNLEWPDGLNADLAWGASSSTSLPTTIQVGHTERIKMSGLDHKWHALNPDNPSDKWIPEGKLEIQPNQKSAEGTVIIGFNTGYVIKRKIAFPIKHSNHIFVR
ncbi:MAG: hypothetical protein ABSG99_07645 [Sedimentisphaerales bacterium]